MSVRRVLVVVAVLAVTGVALATNTKIKVFSAAGCGTSLNPNVDGMAIFKDRFDPEFGPGSELHLHVQDLHPGCEYNVAVYSTLSPNEPDAYTRFDTFTTNASGNATIELLLWGWDRAALGCHPKLQIYQDDGATDGIVTNSELRAEGIAN